MTIGASQTSGERISFFGRGLVPNSTNIKGGYVVVHASATDDHLVDLPNAGAALLSGRSYAGVDESEGQVTSTDNQILVARYGVAKCILKPNTACTAGDVAAYDPADGGTVVPYSSKTQTIIGKFTQTKLSSSSEQMVGVFLTESANKGDGLFAINLATGTPVTNTTTETGGLGYILPANFLQVGMAIRVWAKYNVTSGNSTDTLTLRLRLGTVAGSLLGVGPAVDVTNGGGDIGNIAMTLTIRSIGVSGTMTAAGFIGIAASTSSTGTAGTIAIDTTTINTILPTVQWSAASASDSVRLEDFGVSILT